MSMKTIDAGHTYTVATYDGRKNEPEQIIRFMKRTGPGYPGNVGVHSGTNCQELLRVLIDRVNYLNAQKEHANNLAIVKRLNECVWLFEDRAAELHKIEQFDFRPDDILLAEPCAVCGHVICRGHLL